MDEYNDTASMPDGCFDEDASQGCEDEMGGDLVCDSSPDSLSEDSALEEEYDIEEQCREQETCTNLSIARRGEEAAACYLQRRGYIILEQNWSCLFGEADIICESEEDDCIVFVEVKTRTGIGKGMPEEAVTPKKRMKYERIAACYLQSYAHRETRLRFDIISILTLNNDYAILKHFVNAFGVA